MDQPLKELKGFTGQLELYPDKVVLRRKGFWPKIYQGFTKGDKTLYISQITGVQVKKAGLVNGYVQFTVPGGVESTKGGWDAFKDENTVVFFSRRHNGPALEIKDIFEKLRFAPAHSISGADEIRKFKQLLDEGVITLAEFNHKKKELIGL